MDQKYRVCCDMCGRRWWLCNWYWVKDVNDATNFDSHSLAAFAIEKIKRLGSKKAHGANIIAIPTQQNLPL